MGQFTRDEIEAAFRNYCSLNVNTTQSNQESRHWTDRFADLFTEDCVYFEHHMGTFKGQAAVRAWITRAMTNYPGDQFVEFPEVWHVVDEDNDRVVAYFQNRMTDPGDGQIYEEPNISILTYAGHNKWSYQEDIYNPQRFTDLVVRWMQVKGSAEKV